MEVDESVSFAITDYGGSLKFEAKLNNYTIFKGNITCLQHKFLQYINEEEIKFTTMEDLHFGYS